MIPYVNTLKNCIFDYMNFQTYLQHKEKKMYTIGNIFQTLLDRQISGIFNMERAFMSKLN